MFIGLVDAGTSTSSGFLFTNLLFLIVVLAVAVPLVNKLRRSISEKRRRRWEREGLLDLPAADPEPSDPSD